MAKPRGVFRFARTVTSQARGRPGWLSNIIWHTASWILTNITVTLYWLFARLFNRVIVVGRENIGREPNTLLIANHQSMIDSFLVGTEAFYPRSMFRPYLIPWHPAAVENFFKNPVLAWLSSHWRCIPVRPGRRDPRALHRMTHVLPKGVMCMFAEGTRTRDGTIGRGKPGAGLVILATRPRVIPAAIEGMADLLPIGKTIPRIGKTLYVKYGEPVDYSEFLDLPRTRETAQAIVDKVMERVKVLHAELLELKAEREGGKGKR